MGSHPAQYYLCMFCFVIAFSFCHLPGWKFPIPSFPIQSQPRYKYTILLMSRSQCLMGLTEWLPVLRGGIASFRITNKNLTMKSSAKCVRSKEEAEKIVTNCVSHEEVCKNLKVEELKNYLRDRGLNLSGNKAELSKKAFGSVKLGISKCSTSKEDDAVKEKEKRERLSLESGLIQLPSPLNLKEGWQAGSLYFPNTIESDVEDYLKVHGPKSMVKGSSLLTSKHVVDAAVHNISPNVRYCYVRGRCVPQERTNNPPYEAWVCLQKDDGFCCHWGVFMCCRVSSFDILHIFQLLRIRSFVKLNLSLSLSCTCLLLF